MHRPTPVTAVSSAALHGPPEEVREGREPRFEDAGHADASVRTVRVELALGVLEHPQRRRLAVVWAGGIRMFGCEPVVDADEREIELLAEHLMEEIGHLRRSGDEPAAVDVQEDAVDVVGYERAEP